jgi:hypothetical protein
MHHMVTTSAHVLGLGAGREARLTMSFAEFRRSDSPPRAHPVRGIAGSAWSDARIARRGPIRPGKPVAAENGEEGGNPASMARNR